MCIFKDAELCIVGQFSRLLLYRLVQTFVASGMLPQKKCVRGGISLEHSTLLPETTMQKHGQ